jgi:hypothetical protein
MKLDTTFVAARIIGPAMIGAGVAAITNSDTIVSAIADFHDSAALMVLSGIITLMFGLGVITLHRRWDTFTAILIGVLGYLAVLRGGLSLLAPEISRTAMLYIVVNPRIVPIAGLTVALIGVWLTYAGYISGIFRVEPSSRLK